MTVNPGFGGQKFIPSMLPKIEQARRMIDALAPHVLLEVDGGSRWKTSPPRPRPAPTSLSPVTPSLAVLIMNRRSAS